MDSRFSKRSELGLGWVGIDSGDIDKDGDTDFVVAGKRGIKVYVNNLVITEFEWSLLPAVVIMILFIAVIRK